MSDSGYRDVEHVEPGVTDGFGEYQAGVVADGRTESFRVAGVDEACFDTKAWQRIREQVVGAAIEGAGGDNVRSRSHQGDDGQVQCGLAAGGGNGPDPALQGGNPLLQHGIGGVAQAGVDVTGAFDIE
jgi:hypothetical protein